MAIETLKGITELDGKKVMTNDDRPKDEKGNVDWDAFDELRNERPICVDHEKDMISFLMLTKPASEGGDLNKCQITTLIDAAKIMLEYFNNKFPCRENAMTITKLDEALMWQKKRTEDRIKRCVEGKNEK